MYPIGPPFFRIITPRFLPFIQGGGGHVTGGAFSRAHRVDCFSHSDVRRLHLYRLADLRWLVPKL
ncbi:hypothetical protein FB451DRAFT_1247033 [Mycena latifolia]|nr:hypothetical protein FB451DRAFT_1247033 [Mycena latifolia]